VVHYFNHFSYRLSLIRLNHLYSNDVTLVPAINRHLRARGDFSMWARCHMALTGFISACTSLQGANGSGIFCAICMYHYRATPSGPVSRVIWQTRCKYQDRVLLSFFEHSFEPCPHGEITPWRQDPGVAWYCVMTTFFIAMTFGNINNVSARS